MIRIPLDIALYLGIGLYVIIYLFFLLRFGIPGSFNDFLEDFWEYRFWIGLKTGLVFGIILVLVLGLKIFDGQALIVIK